MKIIPNAEAENIQDESEPIETQKKLALTLGISEPTLKKRMDLPDWPVPNSHPWQNIDVAKIQNLYQPTTNGRVRLSYSAIKTEQLFQRSELTRVQKEILQGKYVEKTVVTQAFVGFVQIYIAALEKLQRALPPIVEHQDAGTVELELRTQLDQMREDLLQETEVQLLDFDKVSKDLLRRRKSRGAGRPSGFSAERPTK